MGFESDTVLRALFFTVSTFLANQGKPALVCQKVPQSFAHSAALSCKTSLISIQNERTYCANSVFGCMVRIWN